jgi:hypothetical protein
MNQAGKIARLDISSPEEPKVLSVLDLGANSGPLYLALTSDEKRLVVSDYFLNEDSLAKRMPRETTRSTWRELPGTTSCRTSAAPRNRHQVSRNYGRLPGLEAHEPAAHRRPTTMAPSRMKSAVASDSTLAVIR